MILHALHRLYQRRAASPNPAERPAPIGFEEKAIPFILELAPDGRLVQIEDTRTPDGKKLIARAERVPAGVKKTSGIAANLLWDTAEYVLGVVTEQPGKTAKPERIAEQHLAFRARIDALPEPVRADAGVAAVLAFLDHLDLDTLTSQPHWDDLRTGNPLLSFRLRGDADLVCQRLAVRSAWTATDSEVEADGTCLITGERAAIERLHTAIKGVRGAQTSGANIVSINNKNESGTNAGEAPAFASFGKQQGYNAPVGRTAANMYTTALNDLLARGSRQRIQVGDASTVFWAEEKTDLEDDFALVFGEPAKDDPAERTERVRALYESFLSGKYASELDATTRFYVLGLAPNAARLAVRFWHVDTVANLAHRITEHVRDLEIAVFDSDVGVLSLRRLLAACAVRGDVENSPPILEGEIVRSILSGTPYPVGWLQLAVRRCRVPKKDKRGKSAPIVSHDVAAVIKACLNRSIRFCRSDKKELSVALDESNTHPAYRLGRLFAAFEKAQELAAERTINRTIRDAYFGGAMTSPKSVFPRLCKLNQHHVRDLRRNKERVRLAGWIEGVINRIGWDISSDQPFPSHLLIEDQGRFAIGYYHQRQAFFTKATPESTDHKEGVTP